MGFRRKDLRNLTDKKSIRDYKILSRRYSYCDKTIAFKYLKKVGILITSHPGNRTFLKASIESHSKTKLWITLAYDNHFNPDNDSLEYSRLLPHRKILDKVNCFIMGPYQRFGGVMYPYFWLTKLGTSSMKDFEYIYCTNGDCILEKPENFGMLLDILGDNDIFPVGWEPNGNRPIFNTTGFIGRTDAILKIINHFGSNFIPLKRYEETTQRMGNTESRFAIAIRDLGLKVAIPENNPFNTQLHIKGGTWYDLVGFRHLHGEKGYAWKMRGKEPRVYSPELEYYDKVYISPVDLEFIKNNQNPKLS